VVLRFWCVVVVLGADDQIDAPTESGLHFVDELSDLGAVSRVGGDGQARVALWPWMMPVRWVRGGR
jgi:hypothetical protein